MKSIQLLVVLALCCSAFAQLITTTTTLAVTSSTPKQAIYYQEPPTYTVTVTAASGSAPQGTVTVTIGGNNRGQCTLTAGTGLVSTCNFNDIKPSASPNLPVGSNSATASFAASATLAASQATATFVVSALPIVSLTYNGASDDVTIPLPTGVTNLVSTIATLNSGTPAAPLGNIVLSQTSTNSGFSNLTCALPATAPYTCTLAIPAAYLAAGFNYTLLAQYVPASGSEYGPDGSKSITVRVLTTATTTTGVSTTTSTTGVTSTTGATTSSPNGYASIVANLVFNGTCAVNFTQTAFTQFILASNPAATSAGYNLTQIGSCVDNNNGSFYVQLQITAINPSVTPIPAAYQTLLSGFQALLNSSLGLTSTGVVIVSFIPAPAPASTTGTTGATTGAATTGTTVTATTGASSTSASGVATGTVTGVSTGANIAATGVSSTSGASSVVVGAAVFLIFAALL